MTDHRRDSSFRRLFLIAALMLCSACAQTAIRPIVRNGERDLPPPARILVYDFAFRAADIIEYQGIMRQQPANRNPLARQQELGKTASATLAENLAAALRRLGFKVERAARGVVAGKKDLVIDGRFLTVDEGSPARRLVIGFGAGAALMETRVHLSGMGQTAKLLEFATRAEGGRLPGAAVTVPVGATLSSGASLALAAGGAAATRMSADSSNVTRLAASSADQAARYLAEYFTKRGWISAEQTRRPRTSY